MHRVFISYKREPSGLLADLIRENLRPYGIRAFVDTYDMGPGSFPEYLRREIEVSTAFVCLLADTTLGSTWVKKEIRHAYDSNKTLIPVFQESFAFPTKRLPKHINALFKSSGVTVLDKRNLFIDKTIETLALLIKPSLGQKRLVSITLNMELPHFNVHKFLLLISGLTFIGLNAINLVGVRGGSIVVDVEMPQVAADRLVDLVNTNRNLFSEYNVVAIETKEIDENPDLHVSGKRVFISYSHVDSLFADYINQHLKDAGAISLIDNDIIKYGSEWRTELTQALQLADALIVLISRNSIESPYVRAEIDYSLEHQKPIIPVLLEHINLPRELTGKMYVDASGQDIELALMEVEILLSEEVP